MQVIFRSGEGALQVLPQLLGVVPEARLNLAIYYLKHGESYSKMIIISMFFNQNTIQYHYSGIVWQAKIGDIGEMAFECSASQAHMRYFKTIAKISCYYDIGKLRVTCR